MEWEKLLTQQRLSEEKKDPPVFSKYYISPFERDYERIVSSAAFRRLQDKTQVFPLAKSDFVRTRLTHSMEVSTIAKQLGIMCFQNTAPTRHLHTGDKTEKNEEQRNKIVGDIEAILSCAGLLHDLGNPPFGHVGEAIIREWFEENLKKIYVREGGEEKPVTALLSQNMLGDLLNFEGNAQTFRILSKARYQSEINLPFSIMGALMKYPTRSDELGNSLIRHKVGCYQSEESTFLQINQELGTMKEDGKVIRHPLAYLVEAADDIAYMTADLEDAVKSHVVNVDELLNFFRYSCKEWGEEAEGMYYTKEIIEELESLNDHEKDKTKVMSKWSTYLRRWLMYVVCWRFCMDYENIMEGKYSEDLFYQNNHSLTVRLLKETMKKFVFDSRIIIEPEVSAQTILNFLLDKFVPAVIRYDSREKMTTQDKKVFNLISSNYVNDYSEAKRVDKLTDPVDLLYRRILIATDFISGMTDGYAKTLYKKMSGTE